MKTICKFILTAIIGSLISLSVYAGPRGKKVVALDGSGDYTSIQEAINSVAPNQEKPTVIYIKNGLYNSEKLLIPSDNKYYV